MKNSTLLIIIFGAISLVVIGYGIYIFSNTSVSDDEILDELDNYFIDEDGEIVIGEIEIPDDLTETDVLNEIDDYLLEGDEDIDIGNMTDFIE